VYVFSLSQGLPRCPGLRFLETVNIERNRLTATRCSITSALVRSLRGPAPRDHASDVS
jgi:hypothetical protein